MLLTYIIIPSYNGITSRAQVKLLRQRFEEALGAEYKNFVDIDTIDGFQVCINNYSWPLPHF